MSPLIFPHIQKPFYYITYIFVVKQIFYQRVAQNSKFPPSFVCHLIFFILIFSFSPKVLQFQY